MTPAHLPGEECMTAGALKMALADVPDEAPVVLWDETGSWEAAYLLYLPGSTAVFRIAHGEQLDTADDRIV